MDGHCWMADNLDLNLNNASIRTALKGTDETGTNTNAPKAALDALRSGGGSDSNGYAQAQWANGALDWTTINSNIYGLANRSGICDPTINTASDNNYPCIAPPPGVTDGYQGNNYNNNTVINKFCLNNGTLCMGGADVANTYYTYGPGNYEIGTYYNYCAASAGSYCYSTSDTTHTDVNATSDICPKGWKIPSGDQVESSYCYLYNKISGITTAPDAATNLLSLQTMFSTPLSGFYSAYSAYRQGTYGRFWSSRYLSTTDMWNATVGGTVVYPQNMGGHRTLGFSVRCLVQQ